MALTIGLDATAAFRQAAGIGRYTRELMAALARRPDDIRYRAFYCAGGTVAGSLPALDGRFSIRAWPVSDRVMNAIWYRLQLPVPVQLLTGSFDLFHAPDFTLPPSGRRPRIVTVHDLAFLTVPECAYPTLRAYLARVVPRSVRDADHVIAVSESTRQDIIRLLDISPQRVTTVLEAASPRFSPGDSAVARAALQEVGIDSTFILSVGTVEPRKNYERLIRAYAGLRASGCDHKLVIVGARGWLYDPVFRVVEALQLEESVRFLNPRDELLPSLYRGAEAFVYPSLYEGFGLPVLEALACGAPCACSGSSSLPEVVGDAALTFDPMSVADISRALERLLGDADLRDRLRHAGPAQAAKFSWDVAAKQTVALYRALAHG